MVSKTFLGILWTKFSIITAATSAYFTYINHDTLNRFVDNIMYNDVSVENGYFNDANGLIIDKQINSEGLEEVYLLHQPSKKNYPILKDMMPPTDSMLECILGRVNGFTNDERKEYLNKINGIEKKLYQNL